MTDEYDHGELRIGERVQDDEPYHEEKRDAEQYLANLLKRISEDGEHYSPDSVSTDELNGAPATVTWGDSGDFVPLQMVPFIAMSNTFSNTDFTHVNSAGEAGYISFDRLGEISNIDGVYWRLVLGEVSANDGPVEVTMRLSANDLEEDSTIIDGGNEYYGYTTDLMEVDLSSHDSTPRVDIAAASPDGVDVQINRTCYVEFYGEIS